MATPSIEIPFHFESKGKVTNQNFTGDFVYKIPNIRALSNISLAKTRLNGELRNIDPETALFHNALATLQHTIVTAPEWWTAADNGKEMFDPNIIFELFMQAMKCEDDWKRKAGWASDEPETKPEPAVEPAATVAA